MPGTSGAEDGEAERLCAKQSGISVEPEMNICLYKAKAAEGLVYSGAE